MFDVNVSRDIVGVSATSRRQCGFLPQLVGLHDWIWRSCWGVLARYNLHFVGLLHEMPLIGHRHSMVPVRNHRRSQGVQWVHLHPAGRKKLGVIYMENL